MASLRFPAAALSPLAADIRRPCPATARRLVGLRRRRLRSGLSVRESRDPGLFPTVRRGGIRAETEEAIVREPMVPPYNVLITGSTKGIGYALAKEFLKAGDNVVICSRSAERVESAVLNLRNEFGEQHVVWFVMLEMGKMLAR